MNETSAKSRAGSARPPRRRRSGLLIKGLVGLLLVFAVVVAAAPALLSTAVGRGWVESAISGAIRGSVTLDGLSLNWLSGQRISGLAVLDPSGATVVRMDSLSTELTLLQALRQELNLGRTEVAGLTATIVADADGSHNLGRALEPSVPAADAAPAPLVIPVTGNFELLPARISVAAPGMETVAFESVTTTLQMAAVDAPIRLDLRGQSRQGDLAGEFAVTGEVRGLLAADGSVQTEQAAVELRANVRDLPVDGIDRVLALNGMLTAALGARANLAIELSGTAAGQDVAATGSSPNATLDVRGRLDEQQFTLAQPAALRLTVTPALFAALAPADPAADGLRLRQAFTLDLALDRLSVPLADFNPRAVSVALRVTADRPLELAGGPGFGDMTLRGLTASVDSERLGQRVAFAAQGEAVTENRPGRFDVSGEVNELFAADGVLQLDQVRINADAALRDLPTAVVDRLAAQQGLLVDLLGPKINLDLTAKSTDAGFDATLNVDAGSFKAPKVALSMGDTLALTAPATLGYTLTPDLLRRLLGSEQALKLDRPAAISLTLETLSAPRPKAGEEWLQPGQTAVRAVLSTDSLTLSGVPDLGTVTVGDLRVALDAPSLTAIRLTLAGALSEGQRGLLAELGASPMKLAIEADTGIDAALQPAPVTVALQLSGSGLDARVRAKLPGDLSRAELTAPADLRLSLTPGLVQRLGAGAAGQSSLAKPATVALKLSALTVPLAPFTPQALKAQLSAAIDEVVLGGAESVKGVALRGAKLDLDYGGTQAAVKLIAQTTIPGRPQPGAVEVDAKLTQLFDKGELNVAAAAVDGSARISDMPTALIAALTGQAGLAALAGDAVNIDATAASSGGDRRSVDMAARVEAPNLSVDLAAVMGDAVTLKRPAKWRLKLTPAAYRAVTGPAADAGGGFTLAEDAVIEGSVDKLQWPLAAAAGASGFDPARAAVTASVTASRLVLRDAQRTAAVDSLVVKIQGPRLDQPVDLSVTGALRGTAPDGSLGRLELTAKVADLFTKAGDFSADGLTLDLKGELQQFPVALADQLLEMDGLTTATLGPSADISIDSRLVKMTGPVTLSVRSSAASATIKARLGNDAISLTEAIAAQLQVTPELGKLVLSNIHPIFETTQSGEQPIRLRIPPEEVRIPITDFDVARVVMPRIELDLGKINLKSGWLLKGIIGLAQQFGALENTGRDQWTAWFTPALLQLRDGRITYDRRMDLLLDKSLHLATWGVADIGKDRAELIVAFMPDTLERVFRLPTGADDALRMPLTGPLSAPSMDFKKATVELGRLRAQKSVTRRDPLAGALFGAVAGKTTGSGGAVPGPSVEPLPWGELPKPAAPEAAQPSPAAEQAAPQPAEAAPEPAKRKSSKEQAIDTLIDILRKPK